MNSATDNRGLDDVQFAVCFAVAVLMPLALTSVAALSALAVISLVRFTGRAKFAVLAFVAALFGFLANLEFGDCQHFLFGLWNTYAEAANSGDWIQIARVWCGAAFDLSAWKCLGPVGAIAGAGFELIRESRRGSDLAALAGKTFPSDRPTPLAHYLRKRMDRQTASGDDLVVGTEWRTGARVAISSADCGKHQAYIGTTGSGKTEGGLMGNIEWCVNNRVGAVVVDGKGDSELARMVTQYAERHGRKAYLLDAAEPARSNCVYHPFMFGDYTSQADKLTTLRVWSVESIHYQKLNEGYAQMVFRVLTECGCCTDLISVAGSLDIKKLLALVRGKRKKMKGAQELMDIISSQRAAEPHIAGIRSELQNIAQSALASLFDTRTAETSGKSLLDVHTARKEGAIVYFALPSLHYPERAAALGRLITNDLKVTAAAMRTPWTLAFDEFGTFAGPQITNLINMGRSFGIRAVISMQSLADISRGAPDAGAAFVDQLLGSINSYFVHRLNAPADAELISSLAGTEQHVAYTAQTIGGQPTGAASARLTKEFKFHPDQLKQLRVGEAIYINKNSGEAVHVRTRRSHITRRDE